MVTPFPTLTTPTAADIFYKKLAANVPNIIPKNPPLRSFVSVLMN